MTLKLLLREIIKGNNTQSMVVKDKLFPKVEFDGLRDSLNPNIEEVLITTHDSVEIKLISGGKFFKRYVSNSGYNSNNGILSFTSIKGEKVNWKGDALFNIISKGKSYYKRVETIELTGGSPTGGTFSNDGTTYTYFNSDGKKEKVKLKTVD